ncbi:MAG: hypothetical protein OJF59_000919 [Cytophagales bacterium]|nr:MAG: hypothetical protein OJF59_000919 [Cytophagales bacterium]
MVGLEIGVHSKSKLHNKDFFAFRNIILLKKSNWFNTNP